jgi:regulator of RNase E activity RraA
MTDQFADRLQACYSGAVFDVLDRMGLPAQVLPQTLRPLDPTRKIAGKAYTVEGHLHPGLEPHTTLFEWTGLLSRAPTQSVVVCQPNDSSLAHMGELSAETLLFRGIRGYVVDGGCRDSDFIHQIGFPVWCRYYTPSDIVGRWKPDTFGEPIVIGEVTISTGDYILADRDGVIVIPAAMAEEVIAKTEAVMQTENLVRKAILEGVDPQEAYLRHGKF